MPKYKVFKGTDWVVNVVEDTPEAAVIAAGGTVSTEDEPTDWRTEVESVVEPHGGRS